MSPRLYWIAYNNGASCKHYGRIVGSEHIMGEAALSLLHIYHDLSCASRLIIFNKVYQSNQPNLLHVRPGLSLGWSRREAIHITIIAGEARLPSLKPLWSCGVVEYNTRAWDPPPIVVHRRSTATLTSAAPRTNPTGSFWDGASQRMLASPHRTGEKQELPEEHCPMRNLHRQNDDNVV